MAIIEARKQMPAHVQAIFQDIFTNMIFIKRQQFLVTNYVIAIYVGIISLWHAANPLDSSFCKFLLIVVWATWLYNVVYIIHIYADIKKLRGYIDWCAKEYFDERERDGLGLNETKPAFFNPGLSVALTVTSLIGALIVTQIVCG